MKNSRFWSSVISTRGEVNLASFVLLKEYVDDKTVVYKFGPNENIMREIVMNKLTRKFFELESLLDKNIPTGFYFDRAAQRLTICLVSLKLIGSSGERIEEITGKVSGKIIGGISK